ncbi:hypothetical protein MsAg5_00580 [Methanosarcinaceae archaeon Ag5]|uniref:Stage II sporulation protein M n=1 Tax=Methanolapillus africanus TaxID=3028297 RepID=A0AAE4SEE8_9EURY|nr:hypothetical protein [Methanosarcinaceae archaeon Ag5]
MISNNDTQKTNDFGADNNNGTVGNNDHHNNSDYTDGDFHFEPSFSDSGRLSAGQSPSDLNLNLDSNPNPSHGLGKRYKTKLFKFLSDHKIYTFWMTAVFAVCFAAGYLLSAASPELMDELIKLLSDSMASESENSFLKTIDIFLNNTRVTVLAVALGFVFGLFPLVTIAFNGAIIGMVSEYSIRMIGLDFLLVGLVPHGIIELPIIILSTAVGFRLGVRTFSKIIGKITWDALAKDFLSAGWGYLFFMLPLLLVAAVIEIYITGTLLDVLFTSNLS